VYEIKLQYQTSPKSKVTEYTKTFYISSYPENKGKIRIYELLPIVFKTPNFLSGTTTYDTTSHYVVGNVCEHHWNGNEVVLPQNNHFEQEGFLGEESFGSESFINKIRYSGVQRYTGKICPLALYFYGKESLNSNAKFIRPNNGFMPLKESTTIKQDNFTIVSSVYKLDWSDNYIEKLFDLTSLVKKRYNSLIDRRDIVYSVTSNLRNNIINILGDYNRLLNKDQEFIDKVVKSFSNLTSNESYYKSGEFSKYESVSNDNFAGIALSSENRFDLKDNCRGGEDLLRKLNYGFVLGKPLLMDLLIEGEKNKDRFKAIIDTVTNRINVIESTKNDLSIQLANYSWLNDKLTSLQQIIHNAYKVLHPNTNEYPVIFQSNEVSYGSESNRKALFDSISYSIVGYKLSSPFGLKVRESNRVRDNFGNPRLKEYLFHRYSSEDYSNKIMLVESTIKNLKQEIAGFVDSVKLHNHILSKSLKDNNVEISLNTLLKDITNDDSIDYSRLIKKENVDVIFFDSCFNDCKNVIPLVKSMDDTYEYVKSRFTYNKDYKLKSKNEYIETTRKSFIPELKDYMPIDKSMGSKLVANIFLQRYSLLNKDAEQFDDFIDDSDILEMLEEIYSLDEDDIEDEIEEILEKKHYTMFNFTKLNSYTYVMSSNKIMQEIQSLLDSCTHKIQNIRKNLELEKSRQSVFLFIKDKIEKYAAFSPNYIGTTLLKQTNIPESKYDQICTFLSNYNISRGTQVDLFEKGNLRNQFVKSYKSVYGEFNLFKNGYWSDLITFNPLNGQWNILTFDSEKTNNSCIGIGDIVTVGFDCSSDTINFGSIFIGGIPEL
jgi:hypothetical protein